MAGFAGHSFFSPAFSRATSPRRFHDGFAFRAPIIFREMEEVKSYTVSVYNDALKRKFDEMGIPPVWVRGTLTDVKHSGRMVYATLAEIRENGTETVASLPLAVFAEKFKSLENKAAAAPVPFRLEKDVKVCLLVKAEFWAKAARFNVTALDVDASFTAGEMQRVRMEILRRLEAEGLLRAQRELELPAAPLRIGLVTSSGSAAEHDFRKRVADSGFAVEIVAVDARMQGAETARTVLAAFEKLAAEDVDCVCLVRGGGSREDLVWFDDEKICRAICAFPAPVLTGIGHEIDHSLADEVAWRDCITPTACADLIVRRLRDAREELDGICSGMERLVRRRCDGEGARLLALGKEISFAAGSRFVRERGRVGQIVLALRHRADAAFSRAAERLRVDAHGLAMGSRKILDAQTALTEARESQIRLADPRRVLERGFALPLDASGRVVRFGDLSAGRGIRLKFAEGSADATVDSVRPEEQGKQGENDG